LGISLPKNSPYEWTEFGIAGQIANSLAAAPTCSSLPKELRALDDKEYRQVFFKRCRLIHRVVGQQVAIYLIADGRRDMQSLLARRLLGGS
jgi:toxin ParE1/3/4